MLQDVLGKWGAYEVTPMDCYKDIFKLGEGYIQRSDEPGGEFKANPVAYFRNKNRNKGHFRIMFEDTFEETLAQLQEATGFAILNGISYFGRRNLQQHASKMFAMIFDLDGVTDKTLNAFMSGAFAAKAYPVPNYLALSGHGVHLYYVFEEPLALFPYTKLQLKDLKYALTEKMWNAYTSTDEKVQQQGINQGFRVLGGQTKDDAPERRVRVFRLNEHPFSLEQLCQYVSIEHRVDQEKLWKESKYTLAQAKRKFPDWYERVVVQGDKSRQYWDISQKVHGDNPYALYDWWLERIKAGASYHHRYFSVMCLAIYGAKCRKPYEDVEADALALVPFLNSINPADPFTEADCMTALECYDLRYCTFPIKDISKISGIPIERNKRNGRKRAEHIRLMNFIRDELNGNTDWRNTKGAPTAQAKVAAYRQEHPEASVSEVARELNISRTTVYKWWDGEAKKPKKESPASAEPVLWGLTQQQLDERTAALVDSIMSLPQAERQKLLDELARKK